jgi:Esterase-like activity of phytase
MRRLGRVGRVALVAAFVAPWAVSGDVEGTGGGSEFERVGTFVVCQNTSCDRSQVEETVAEIVTASADGRTLAYADSLLGAVGFVDISNPELPQGRGVVMLGGSPTSVATAGAWLLVGIDTSGSFLAPSGRLDVFDLTACAAATATCVPAASIDMGGQPDSVAVSPDGRYAAIAIENQRDEDVNDGELPQLPAGFLQVVRLAGPPTSWTAHPVSLTGLAQYAPEDPEPEYVSINALNVAAVTLQENNHVVLVHLPTRTVLHDFPAGRVTGSGFDTEEDGVIRPDGALADVPREPDAVAWLDPLRLVTANEGDLFGGTRGFTVFGALGHPLFDAGTRVDDIAQSHGHYPEDRSENKGTEPEGVLAARFGQRELFFVGSERGDFVAVYEDRGLFQAPRFLQALPTGIGPEGLLAIPQRNLFVAAAETDEGVVRSQITIFRLRDHEASYPQVVSATRTSGPLAGHPIGWVALSALAADRQHANRLYTAHDSFLRESRLYVLDVGATPAVIRAEIPLRRDGAPVDYDLEGLAQRTGGGFWAVSEGAGNAPNATAANLLVEIAADGTVVREVALPAAVNALQRNNGFEGVTVTGSGLAERVFVAFQREWTGDPARRVRIGEYRPAEDAWRFFYYPIEAVASPAGGFVGLSEIVATSADRLLVLERDNVGGPDARIKRVYAVSIDGVVPQPQGGAFPVLTKTLVRDLLPALRATKGWTQEKIEGLTVAANGRGYAVTDNDGVDENTGETILLRLGPLH